METKIKNGKNDFLYCAVDIEIGNYRNMYDSPEVCFEDIRPEIIEDCKARGYTDDEVSRVLNHYELLLNSANGEWKDETK